MVRRFKFWPSTLAVQLIAVTAAAVAMSNIAVAFWFEYSNERQSETALTERVLDRATAVATTLSSIRSSSRQVLMNSMSSRIWKFTEIPTPATMQPMTDAEIRLARRIDEQLPDTIPNQKRIEVQLDEPVSAVPHSQIPTNPAPHTGMVRMLVPVDKNTMLNTVFLRPAAPWPVEIIVATVVAILLASAGAAFMARRIVRPLSELTDAASVVASGSGAPHVAENGPEDVRKAATAFNTMAGKVTRTLESQRHLLSAVGHDLRTPITAMRINLEFVEDDDLREGLLRNLDELHALTEQVLSAARGTGGEIKRNVDLSALVESLCTDMDEIGEPVSWANATAPAVATFSESTQSAIGIRNQQSAAAKAGSVSPGPSAPSISAHRSGRSKPCSGRPDR